MVPPKQEYGLLQSRRTALPKKARAAIVKIARATRITRGPRERSLIDCSSKRKTIANRLLVGRDETDTAFSLRKKSLLPLISSLKTTRDCVCVSARTSRGVFCGFMILNGSARTYDTQKSDLKTLEVISHTRTNTFRSLHSRTKNISHTRTTQMFLSGKLSVDPQHRPLSSTTSPPQPRVVFLSHPAFPSLFRTRFNA